MRIALFVLAPLLACASSDPPPPSKTAERPTEAAPTATTAQPVPAPDDEIRLSCVSGPGPLVDGRAVVERIVEMRHDFAMMRMRMNKPPHRSFVQSVSEEQKTSLRSLAGRSHAGPRPSASPPVPDGTACRLRITLAGKTIDEPVDVAPSPGPTADLVHTLRIRMTQDEPTWPAANDPEIDTCRAAVQDPNVARFLVDEIVIEQDGTHRWMFVDPTEPSTANHFGCRIRDGKALILPEG